VSGDGDWLRDNVFRTPLAIILVIALAVLALGLAFGRHADPMVIVFNKDADASVRTIDDSLFDYDDYELNSKGVDKVKTIATGIKPGTDVLVVGYADARGSDAHNDLLTRHRAEAVGAALTADGVTPLRSVGVGKRVAHLCTDQPAAEREDCFKGDRRVEIWTRAHPVAEVAQASPK